MKNNMISCAAAFAAFGAMAQAADVQEILEGYAADYAEDVTFTRPTFFGVRVGNDFYTVDMRPKVGDVDASTVVTRAPPSEPTYYFTIDNAQTLDRLNNGDVNALTLMAKAFSTDVTPMDIEVMEGFAPGEDFTSVVIPLTFHFWTKGKPEIVDFANQDTQQTHGSNAGIFYYQPGFRSGWFDIRPGDHVNKEERSKTNPFPSLFVMIEGEVTAIIDGERMIFRQGEAMIAPTGVSHEFINEGENRAFGFIFMFGEGA